MLALALEHVGALSDAGARMEAASFGEVDERRIRLAQTRRRPDDPVEEALEANPGPGQLGEDLADGVLLRAEVCDLALERRYPIVLRARVRHRGREHTSRSLAGLDELDPVGV
jgi:hypothetical protein